MFKTKELPVDKNTGKYYEDPETGYFYYGYCIELIYKIQESMKVNEMVSLGDTAISLHILQPALGEGGG